MGEELVGATANLILNCLVNWPDFLAQQFKMVPAVPYITNRKKHEQENLIGERVKGWQSSVPYQYNTGS